MADGKECFGEYVGQVVGGWDVMHGYGALCDVMM